MLVLSAADVERLLDLDRLVDAVAAAMVELSAGRTVTPPRAGVDVPSMDGRLFAMPALLPAAGALVTKVATVFPRNTDRPTTQAVICCFDPRHGTPLAVMDGTAITAARTAAGSVLAARLLARPDSRTVSIVGTGTLARSHARAFARREGVEVLQVVGRDRGRTMALVDELTAAGIPVVAGGSIEAAVRSADIVCLTTHADRPVLRREWLRPGTHVNALGYNPAGDGEVDVATIAAAVVAVESRAAALADPPAGAVEFQRAREAGLGEDVVHAELGELVAGTRPGRSNEQQLTLYKSVGVAAQDAAAAALILETVKDS
ncbi:MAG: ornithine cyclodeaminase family protein [Actinomycetota bacterium]